MQRPYSRHQGLHRQLYTRTLSTCLDLPKAVFHRHLMKSSLRKAKGEVARLLLRDAAGQPSGVGLHTLFEIAGLTDAYICPPKGHTASTLSIHKRLLLVAGNVLSDLQQRPGLAVGTVALHYSGARQGLEIQDLMMKADQEDQEQVLQSAKGAFLQ